MYPPGLTQFK